MNDNLSLSLARILNPIPFEQVGKPGRRASEIERDNAAIELAAHVIAMLKFYPGDILYHRDDLLQRANKVRRSQGNGDMVFVVETVAETVPSADAYEATEARLALVMGDS